MARDRQPITKQSRREGYALHPKAHKIMVKRNSPPGQQTRRRPAKQSQFAIQLREKQKVKRIYGLLERQFKRLMKEADKTKGKSGEVLLQLLERRLDNVIYRAGFSVSRRGARQLVSHGHFLLNGRRVNVPSMKVVPGDEVIIRDKSKKSYYFENIDELTTQVEHAAVSWLRVNRKKFQITVTGLPKREEAEVDINEQLIVEYYSR
jgi:small subunit ribosomal protein S4